MHRTAYTLTELLVSLGVLTLLAGLLLPAVQSAREASRRTAKLSDLRGVTLASHHHEATSHRLPSNGRFPHRSDWPRQLAGYLDKLPDSIAAADSWRDGFVNRGPTGCRLADVLDGLSCTVAFGAVTPPAPASGVLDLLTPAFRSTADPHAFRLPRGPSLFAFGDGGARAVRPNSAILPALGTRAGGD